MSGVKTSLIFLCVLLSALKVRPSTGYLVGLGGYSASSAVKQCSKELKVFVFPQCVLWDT